MTLYTFPDAQLAVLTILRNDPSVPAGVTFGTVPNDADHPHALPYASVRLDRTVSSLKSLQVATIRVVVWHEDEAQGLALAQALHAVLLAHTGDASVRNFGELTGPVPASDPDTSAPLSYFTVAARLRPLPL